MTVQTTTLPAADPIRLGNNQPIRRRALTPRVADAGPPEESAPEEQTPEQPETDVSVAAAPVAKPRGRQRKDVVDTIAAGRAVRHVLPLDELTLGHAVVQAKRCRMTLEEYVVSIRGILNAYDALSQE
jgi:hypothetical protein